jgi:hypothetical protein
MEQHYWLYFIGFFAVLAVVSLWLCLISFEESKKNHKKKSKAFDKALSPTMGKHAAKHQGDRLSAIGNAYRNSTDARVALNANRMAYLETLFTDQRAAMMQESERQMHLTLYTKEECAREVYRYAAKLGFSPPVWDAICLALYGGDMGKAMSDVYLKEKLADVDVKRLVETKRAELSALKELHVWKHDRQLGGKNGQA